MTPQEIAAIIVVARRAPLKNMDEAAAVDQLLQKLEEYFKPKKSEKQTFLQAVPGGENAV